MVSPIPRQEVTALVVDDDPRIARSLVRILTGAGYGRVLSSVDSTEVVELCERLNPDLLLLDLSMPEPDGFAVLEQLSSRVGAAMPRTVVLTGHEHPSIERQALQLGARAVVAKTTERDALVALLDALLEAEG